jgi:hypothetical protein
MLFMVDLCDYDEPSSSTTTENFLISYRVSHTLRPMEFANFAREYKGFKLLYFRTSSHIFTSELTV